MGQLAFGTDAGLWDVMSTMRAMRKLKPDPVPRELLPIPCLGNYSNSLSMRRAGRRTAATPKRIRR